MIIDSHQHFWNYELPKHDWIDDDMAAIRRDFTPQDLKPILDENGIDGCIAVQADQTLEETNFLLGLADKHDWMKGVVGWIDLRADDLEAQLDRYADQPKLKGFRHVVQGEPDPFFMLQPEFLRGIDMIGQRGYTYDILIFPHQLVSALELVKQFPGYSKLSGLITEANYKTWTTEELLPYLKHTLAVFGPERCMFGSDWPVCRVAGEYDRVKDLLTTTLTSYSEEEKAGVWGKNAMTFYGI